jgi:hypothetical protein
MEKKKQTVAYLLVCIRDFGKAHNLTPKEAYAYLERHKGLQFLIDCYEAEHTLSLEDAVADMTDVCYRNGGQLR